MPSTKHTDPAPSAAQAPQQAALLAADEPSPAPALPARIAAMITLHGPGPAGQTCAACAHLIAIYRTRAYYKCSQSAVTAGAATDWRAKWPACGLFESITADKPRRRLYPSD